MYPSDSISAFGGPGFEIFLLGEGEAGSASGARLPQDVIDALNEDNLELAMFLLDRHREEEEPQLTSSKRSRSSKVRRFFAQMIRLPTRKKVASRMASSRNKPSKTVNNRTLTQIAAVITMASAAAGRIVISVSALPVKIVQAAMGAAQQAAAATIKFLDKTLVKPVQNFVLRPVIQIAEKIGEQAKVIQQYIGARYEKIVEKVHELQEKMVQTVEKVAQEIRELAEPVKLWLDKKFDQFLKTQKWVNTAVGKEMTKIGEQSIQVVAYALVPVTFTIKQIRKGYQKAVGRIRKGAEGALSKAKKWINGKLAKGLMLFNQAFQTFKSAIERLALQWLKWILGLLKKVVKITLRILRLAIRLIKACARIFKRTFLHLTQRALLVLRW